MPPPAESGDDDLCEATIKLYDEELAGALEGCVMDSAGYEACFDLIRHAIASTATEARGMINAGYAGRPWMEARDIGALAGRLARLAEVYARLADAWRELGRPSDDRLERD